MYFAINFLVVNLWDKKGKEFRDSPHNVSDTQQLGFLKSKICKGAVPAPVSVQLTMHTRRNADI